MSAPYDNNYAKAIVIRHVDADTTHVRVDAGYDIEVNLTVRWYGIDAPEISTPEGMAALDWVEAQIPVGTTVWIQGIKDKREKYGRYLARIFLPASMVCLNDELLARGMARPYTVEGIE